MNNLKRLVFSQNYSPIYSARLYISHGTVPRITVPKSYTDALTVKLQQQKFTSVKDKPQPSKKQVVISCKNNRKVHYLGQEYPSWSENRLASASWRHKERSKNDHFTILNYCNRPSFMTNDENAGEKSLGFEHFIETEILLKNLRDLKLKRPTIVQALTIPHVLSGRNVVCSSETGSGKTLAYLLPLIENLFAHRCQYPPSPSRFREDVISPNIIILAPTKELCIQINNMTKLLTPGLDLSSSVCVKSDPEVCGEHSDIVIGTPGCVAGLVKSRHLSSSSLLGIVLDEADTLMDASFSTTVMQILGSLPIQTHNSGHDELSVGVQVVLVSATMPQNIQKVFGEYLPIESFQVVKTPFLHRLLPNISQKFIRTTAEDRPALLLQQVKRLTARCMNTIIFCNRNDVAAEVHDLLTENQINHLPFYKYAPTEDREEAYQSFQDGVCNILLTTDLGSRGLDTKYVKHVINYEFPPYLSDYLHRLGRVGRIGSKHSGTVTNYVVHKWDVDLVQHIESTVRRSETLENVNANIKEHLQTVMKQRQIEKQDRRKSTPLKPLPTEKDFE